MELLKGLALGTAINMGWIAASMAIFVTLARFMPCNPNQPVFQPRSIAIDVCYWAGGGLVYGLLSHILVAIGISWRFDGDKTLIEQFMQKGYGPLATLPVFVQILLIMLLSDIVQYWLHRLFHGNALWKYHAIHHAPVHVDWHTCARFHPVNFFFYSTLLGVGVSLLGFSQEAFILMMPFNILYSALVHANLNWTFGPFRYLLASPVYHRWHHTSVREGGAKNYAPTFPFLDLLFGTYYMPEGKLPQKFGIEGPQVPETLLGQMAYPFRQMK